MLVSNITLPLPLNPPPPHYAEMFLFNVYNCICIWGEVEWHITAVKCRWMLFQDEKFLGLISLLFFYYSLKLRILADCTFLDPQKDNKLGFFYQHICILKIFSSIRTEHKTVSLHKLIYANYLFDRPLLAVLSQQDGVLHLSITLLFSS